KDDNDKIWSQYKYPSVYSDYHSPRHYKMFTTDIPVFNLFTAQALGTQGWNAPWLDIARKFFLWGVSKEFFPGRDNERILDYMIALESLLVIDNDFISKQIRERAAALHPITGIKELINKFYAFRSIIAHGSKLNSKAIDYINKNMDNFEDIVRCLLLKAITLCPSDEDKRNVFLLSLYKITDKDRAEKIIADYKKIKLSKIQHAIRSELGTTRGRPE
ncbi:MAG: HEPN domain-containing protein, partial [Proteobacteria bacterium]|nr:HEPN domain-containing protein [Pseudomonadota bacterium]